MCWKRYVEVSIKPFIVVVVVVVFVVVVSVASVSVGFGDIELLMFIGLEYIEIV